MRIIDSLCQIVQTGGNVRLERSGRLIGIRLSDEQRAVVRGAKPEVLRILTNPTRTEKLLLIAANFQRVNNKELCGLFREIAASSEKSDEAYEKAVEKHLLSARRLIEAYAQSVTELDGIDLSVAAMDVFGITVNEAFA